jgi:hypothetical protein
MSKNPSPRLEGIENVESALDQIAEEFVDLAAAMEHGQLALLLDRPAHRVNRG